MNNKTLIIVIVGLIAIGGLLLIIGQLGGKKSKNQQASAPAATQQTQGGQSAGPAQGKPITETITTVSISSSGFEPKSITIKNNTKVIWINKSGADVDITPSNNYAPLTLGQFPTNSSVQLFFDKTGTFTYQNKLKSDQTGTVVVQ